MKHPISSRSLTLVAVSFALAGALAVGCQSSDSNSDDDNSQGGDGTDSGGGATGGNGGTPGVGGGGANSGGGTNAGGNNSGGTNGGDGSGNAGTGTGGAGGSAVACGSGHKVTLAQLNNPKASGHIAPSTGSGSGVTDNLVTLTGVVATSPKFLVSKSKTTGACLWGVYVTTAGSTVSEYGSIQIVAKGEAAVATTSDPTKAECPNMVGMNQAGTIPDNVKPGDKLDITGYFEQFNNATCGTADPKTPGKNYPSFAGGALQVSAVHGCAVVNGSATVPSPAAVADITTLTNTADADTGKWGGALVKITGSFTALAGNATDNNSADWSPNYAVSKYGEIDAAVGGKYIGLPVKNDIAFNAMTGGGGAANYSYPLTQTFTSFTGIHYVDFCGWSLSTRSKCGDVGISGTDPNCSSGAAGAGGSR